MLVEDQLVEIKWNNYTKQWYQDKGYIFTHVGDHFKIHIKDLMLTSSVKVLVKCDYCGRTYLKSYCDYNKSTKMGTQKNACSHCGHKKSLETKNTKEIYYKKFCEMCKAKGYIPLSSQSDYINAHCKLKFLCPVHGEQEITYASLYSGCGCNLCGYTKSSEANRKSISEVIKIVESKTIFIPAVNIFQNDLPLAFLLLSRGQSRSRQLLAGWFPNVPFGNRQGCLSRGRCVRFWCENNSRCLYLPSSCCRDVLLCTYKKVRACLQPQDPPQCNLSWE